MAAESICDGCGKRAPMLAGPDGRWRKPDHWYERSDKDGIQTACSRVCILNLVANGTRKTDGVLPCGQIEDHVQSRPEWQRMGDGG